MDPTCMRPRIALTADMLRIWATSSHPPVVIIRACLPPGTSGQKSLAVRYEGTRIMGDTAETHFRNPGSMPGKGTVELQRMFWLYLILAVGIGATGVLQAGINNQVRILTG